MLPPDNATESSLPLIRCQWVLSMKQLDELYQRYGFTKIGLSEGDVRVYSLSRGYFHNADVVALTGDLTAAEATKAALERSGYSARVRPFLSLEQAEAALFDGFFATGPTKLRLANEYERFSKRLSDALGGDYQYIDVTYSVEESAISSPESGIVKRIARLLSEPGPRLVLLEAAAGFGKTCTAYEVLNTIVGGGSERIPLLTELSRNRQAKIFRYVLLDEIDRNFPGIHSDLIAHYIRSGKIPLIIDGFDELLQGSSPTHVASFEDAETMLETIRGLIGRDAKILLTTRKTAILSGDDFDRWLGEHDLQFDVHRFRLEPPTPGDWIGSARMSIAEANGIPLRELANPVLLTFLRNLTDAEYEKCCSGSSGVVDEYFSRLLERERSRQDLQMIVKEQLSVFRQLASEMLDLDINAESREYVCLRIQESNAPLLALVRERYTSDVRPSIEELVNKLVNHALLDRFGAKEDSIGFINDFVFGSLIGDTLMAKHEEGAWIGSESLAMLAVTAFRARPVFQRRALYRSLASMLQLMDTDLRVATDVNLTGLVGCSLRAASIQGHEFEGAFLADSVSWTDCVVTDCKFSDLELDLSRMAGCTFINCCFYRCQFYEDPEAQPNGFAFIGCSGSESYDEFAKQHLFGNAEDVHEAETDQGEREVLERFWPPGRANFTERKATRILFLGRSGARADRMMINQAIKNLESRGIISVERQCAKLNTNKLAEIKHILGRD